MACLLIVRSSRDPGAEMDLFWIQWSMYPADVTAR
jgi:hypothetical protein